jgi:hypothetical protein
MNDKENCGNCIETDNDDGPFCSNCYGVDGTTEISSDFWCKNWRAR